MGWMRRRATVAREPIDFFDYGDPDPEDFAATAVMKRIDRRPGDSSGRNGLTALLWGEDVLTPHGSTFAIDAVTAGWHFRDFDYDAAVSVLSAILHGHDLTNHTDACRMADRLRAMGWQRITPQIGDGYVGAGNNPLTEDEEAAVAFAIDEGERDPVEVFNEVLRHRPVDDVVDAVGEPEAPAHPLSVVHDEVARLFVKPWESLAPHCVHEYNGGVANALTAIRAIAYAEGMVIAPVAQPPEERPDEDDEPSILWGPGIAAPTIPPGTADRIGERMSEALAPLLAALAAHQQKRSRPSESGEQSDDPSTQR